MSELTKGDQSTSVIDETYDENFSEDAIHEKIKKTKGKKGLNGWFRQLFPRESVEYNPVLLTDEEYIKDSIKAFRYSLELIDGPDWKEHKTGVEKGDIVHMKMSEKFGKVFLLTAVVNCEAKYLNNELHNKTENVIKWNPTILESKTIRKINESTDITYQVTAGGGGGAVKPRDFINLRYNNEHDGRIFSSGISIEYPGYPPTIYTRGDNKVGCWCMTPIPAQNPDDIERCTFQWLMACDLKGWIPQYVVDVAMPTVMFDFLHYIREYLKQNESEDSNPTKSNEEK